MVFPIVSSFIDKSVEFDAKCDLTGINVQYIDIVNMLLVDHREVRWVERKL